MNNKTIILQELLNKQFTFNDLIVKGFKDDNLIKSVKNKENPLLREIIFFENNYYEGFTLKVKNNEHFSVVKNKLSHKQAEYKTKIQQLEYEIETLEKNIWAYRFEFKNEKIAQEYEQKVKLNLAKIKMINAKEQLENN